MMSPKEGAKAPNENALDRLDNIIGDLKVLRRSLLAAALLSSVDDETLELIRDLSVMGHRGNVGQTLRELIRLANINIEEGR